MTKDKLRKADNSKTFCYEFYINSWSIDVEFNRYASVFSYESDHEYEESFSVVLDGHLVYTSATNKKMKNRLFASLIIEGVDFWYDSQRRTDREISDRSIGRLVYQRYFERLRKGHFLHGKIYVPKKSYETLLAYLAYKGKACVRMSGTDMQKTEFRGVLRSHIYYIKFKGEEHFDSEDYGDFDY